jgi:hypothetical protein
MNMIKLFTNMLIVLLLISLASKTLASTKIHYNEQELAFDTSPRLSDVLAKIPNKPLVYWPAATLYLKSKGTLEVTRRKAISKLAIQSTNKQTSNMLKRLERDITSWKLGKRMSVSLDYDLARTVNAHNPVITKGNYILKAGPRSKVINIFGAINSDVKQVQLHRNHTPVSDYINNNMLSTHADKKRVILIQADGRIIQISTLDWNKKTLEIMPGSQIYIPFKTTFWDSHAKSLNQQIVTLAANRVLP